MPRIFLPAATTKNNVLLGEESETQQCHPESECQRDVFSFREADGMEDDENHDDDATESGVETSSERSLDLLPQRDLELASERFDRETGGNDEHGKVSTIIGQRSGQQSSSLPVAAGGAESTTTPGRASAGEPRSERVTTERFSGTRPHHNGKPLPPLSRRAAGERHDHHEDETQAGSTEEGEEHKRGKEEMPEPSCLGRERVAHVHTTTNVTAATIPQAEAFLSSPSHLVDGSATPGSSDYDLRLENDGDEFAADMKGNDSERGPKRQKRKEISAAITDFTLGQRSLSSEHEQKRDRTGKEGDRNRAHETFKVVFHAQTIGLTLATDEDFIVVCDKIVLQPPSTTPSSIPLPKVSAEAKGNSTPFSHHTAATKNALDKVSVGDRVLAVGRTTTTGMRLSDVWRMVVRGPRPLEILFQRNLDQTVKKASSILSGSSGSKLLGNAGTQDCIGDRIIMPMCNADAHNSSAGAMTGAAAPAAPAAATPCKRPLGGLEQPSRACLLDVISDIATQEGSLPDFLPLTATHDAPRRQHECRREGVATGRPKSVDMATTSTAGLGDLSEGDDRLHELAATGHLFTKRDEQIRAGHVQSGVRKKSAHEGPASARQNVQQTVAGAPPNGRLDEGEAESTVATEVNVSTAIIAQRLGVRRDQQLEIRSTPNDNHNDMTSIPLRGNCNERGDESTSDTNATRAVASRAVSSRSSSSTSATVGTVVIPTSTEVTRILAKLGPKGVSELTLYKNLTFDELSRVSRYAGMNLSKRLRKATMAERLNSLCSQEGALALELRNVRNGTDEEATGQNTDGGTGRGDGGRASGIARAKRRENGKRLLKASASNATPTVAHYAQSSSTTSRQTRDPTPERPTTAATSTPPFTAARSEASVRKAILAPPSSEMSLSLDFEPASLRSSTQRPDQLRTSSLPSSPRSGEMCTEGRKRNRADGARRSPASIARNMGHLGGDSENNFPPPPTSIFPVSTSGIKATPLAMAQAAPQVLESRCNTPAPRQNHELTIIPSATTSTTAVAGRQSEERLYGDHRHGDDRDWDDWEYVDAARLVAGDRNNDKHDEASWWQQDSDGDWSACSSPTAKSLPFSTRHHREEQQRQRMPDKAAADSVADADVECKPGANRRNPLLGGSSHESGFSAGLSGAGPDDAVGYGLDRRTGVTCDDVNERSWWGRFFIERGLTALPQGNLRPVRTVGTQVR